MQGIASDVVLLLNINNSTFSFARIRTWTWHCCKRCLHCYRLLFAIS